MEQDFNLNKVIFVLRDLFKNSEYAYIRDILNFSRFSLEINHHQIYRDAYDLKISTLYEIYSKHYSIIDSIQKILKKEIEKIAVIDLEEVKILPDYDKIEIINTEIKPIYTKWDDINLSQLKLIELLKKSSNSDDFQNIGNTCRTLLLKLAEKVFSAEKHTPKDHKIDVSPGKYKNQLHSYIISNLSGSKNKKLRQFAESAINTVEDAIDLANEITHKLDAEKEIAEICIIGTIGVISIIRFAENSKD